MTEDLNKKVDELQDEQLNEVDGGYPQSHRVVTTGKLV